MICDTLFNSIKEIFSSPSPLATPTELMATSVRESKILNAKRNEVAKSSSTPTKPLIQTFPRTGVVNVKIPPKVLPKTTFAKSLASRPRPLPTLSVKSNFKVLALAEKLIPTETSTQITETQTIENPQKPKLDAFPMANEERVLLHQNNSEKVLLPDTSLPPPNFLAPTPTPGQNSFQLPDITRLPPPIVNQPTIPLPDNSSLTLVHSDLAEETSPNPLSTSKTFLEDTMETFLQDKEEKEKTVSTRMSQNKIEPLKFDINVNLIKSQLGR